MLIQNMLIQMLILDNIVHLLLHCCFCIFDALVVLIRGDYLMQMLRNIISS